MVCVACFPASTGPARRAPREAAAGLRPGVCGEPGGNLRLQARRSRALSRLWYDGQNPLLLRFRVSGGVTHF